MSKRVTLEGIDEHEFRDQISSVMSIYSYNSQGADYSCGFCHKRPRYNSDPINHDENCFGQRLLNSLPQATQ